MSDAAPPKKIWLGSNDNATIEVERAVAERSMLIKNLLEDTGDENISQSNPIPIPNVSLAPLPRRPYPMLTFCCR